MPYTKALWMVVDQAFHPISVDDRYTFLSDRQKGQVEEEANQQLQKDFEGLCPDNKSSLSGSGNGCQQKHRSGK